MRFVVDFFDEVDFLLAEDFVAEDLRVDEEVDDFFDVEEVDFLAEVVDVLRVAEEVVDFFFVVVVAFFVVDFFFVVVCSVFTPISSRMLCREHDLRLVEMNQMTATAATRNFRRLLSLIFPRGPSEIPFFLVVFFLVLELPLFCPIRPSLEFFLPVACFSAR